MLSIYHRCSSFKNFGAHVEPYLVEVIKKQVNSSEFINKVSEYVESKTDNGNLEKEQVKEFKRLMIETFQYGYKSYTKKKEEHVLPECDIDRSLENKNSHAYVMVDDNNMILGGLIVNIDNDTNINYLDFIFIRVDSESNGIGQKMWKEVEKLYPTTFKWQTCTPYFDRRNIHFYVNKLGFKIVEYFNKYHKDPNGLDIEDDEFFEEDGGMFEFEKVMK